MCTVVYDQPRSPDTGSEEIGVHAALAVTLHVLQADFWPASKGAVLAHTFRVARDSSITTMAVSRVNGGAGACSFKEAPFRRALCQLASAMGFFRSSACSCTGRLSSVSRLMRKQIAALAVFSRNYCLGCGLTRLLYALNSAFCENQDSSAASSAVRLRHNVTKGAPTNRLMRIASVAGAFPRNYYTQEEIATALRRHWAKHIENPKVLDRLMGRVAVDGRHLALPIEAYDDLTTWGKSNDAWITVAEDLAEQSICRALARAGLSEADLDAIFFVSVTGIASPSIDARLMNRMNLRTDIKRNPIFGLGCVAGAAGIARAAYYVRAYPGHNAVLVSVELCSLTW